MKIQSSRLSRKTVTEGRMSERQPSEGQHVERVEIVYELPPSPQGRYEYEREDGTNVHGDASGEWTLDTNGDLEDIMFFASPRWMGYGRKAE